MAVPNEPLERGSSRSNHGDAQIGVDPMQTCRIEAGTVQSTGTLVRCERGERQLVSRRIRHLLAREATTSSGTRPCQSIRSRLATHVGNDTDADVFEGTGIDPAALLPNRVRHCADPTVRLEQLRRPRRGQRFFRLPLFRPRVSSLLSVARRSRLSDPKRIGTLDVGCPSDDVPGSFMRWAIPPQPKRPEL